MENPNTEQRQVHGAGYSATYPLLGPSPSCQAQMEWPPLSIAEPGLSDVVTNSHSFLTEDITSGSAKWECWALQSLWWDCISHTEGQGSAYCLCHFLILLTCCTCIIAHCPWFLAKVKVLDGHAAMNPPNFQHCTINYRQISKKGY